MRRKTRSKVKKGAKIIAIIIGIILIIFATILIVKLNKKQDITYEDCLVGKNYFCEITIDLNNKKVKRDNIETTMQEEFGISKEQENLAFSSIEEMKKFFSDSVFDISINENIFTITNKFQTKKFLVKSNDVKEKVEGEEIVKLQEDLYLLSFTSEKLTKAMYTYYNKKDYIDKIFLDEVFINKPTNEISQTMYGNLDKDLSGYKSLGATYMGLDNYKKIISENGNPETVIIATIGYGMDLKNSIFENRIDKNGYNFILDNYNLQETISQGSKIGEVLIDSTSNNVKLLPLVVVTEEGYSSIVAIVKAISYGVKNSDVICYELINKENEAINLALKNAFKENIPVSCVSVNSDDNHISKHAMTIAVSSLDRDSNIADYSGEGEYIDFSAPSTDIEEIFNKSSTVSRWSGPQYSNAQIVSAIALIKTYLKDATILEIYNFLRNFSVDLGDTGKDGKYGYGCPVFKDLTISDIDKKNPIILDVVYDNENWEILKKVKISAKDNIRIYRWAITKNEINPGENEWNILDNITANLDVTADVNFNGIYYIYVQDTAGNITTQKIEVNRVDNTPPKIAYTINKENLNQGIVTINVTAVDEESGLYDSPFSWDEITWSLDNSQKVVNENGRYNVYSIDNLGNKSMQEILVDCFPQEGTYELIGGENIIEKMIVSADWTENINNNVQITFKENQNIISWQITENINIPTNFVELVQNIHQNTTQNNENQTNENSNNQINQNSVITSNIIENKDRYNINSTTSDLSNVDNIEENSEPQIGINEQITINTQLSINKIYYLWIKDAKGNIKCQSFMIAKAEI